VATPSQQPSYFSLTLTAWILALVGWAGLVSLMVFMPLTPTGNPSHPLPSSGARWLFFMLWLMALTGSAIPFVRYLHRRFAHAPVVSSVLLRQALWVGLFGATCAWLQTGRLLNPAIAALIAAGLGGIEWFLRMREHSRWAPESESDEPA
jgi:hypothetical protein